MIVEILIFTSLKWELHHYVKIHMKIQQRNYFKFMMKIVMIN